MIELRHVTKRYGALCALDDVSLKVGAGEAVALLGPNGSGKTTVLKCAAGLVAPTSGSVRIAGGRTQASYLPQHVAFEDHLSCREVVEFFRRLRRLPPRRTDEAIEAWGLAGLALHPVGQLSGGMLQRLGVAVATLAEAPALLLDEPTANLDPEAALALRRSLREWKAAGKAILFASHALADAEAAADRVAILLSGRVAALEPLAVLRTRLDTASLEEVYLQYVEDRPGPGGRAVVRMPARAARTR